MSLKITDTGYNNLAEKLRRVAMERFEAEYCAPYNGVVSCPLHGLMAPLKAEVETTEGTAQEGHIVAEYCCGAGKEVFRAAFPDVVG